MNVHTEPIDIPLLNNIIYTHVVISSKHIFGRIYFKEDTCHY